MSQRKCPIETKDNRIVRKWKGRGMGDRRKRYTFFQNVTVFNKKGITGDK